MTPADELRTAAARLRGSHRYDGIKVDSDSRETLLLLRDLLAARDPLATWLESWVGYDVPADGPHAEDYRSALDIARAINGTREGE